VYVLSTERDAGNNIVVKEAQCIFATGNLQGNIVSRDFALKLGYTESQFGPLKQWEQNGGTSVTGHTFSPEGTVYLSWYRRRDSPRVFRDMRFLVVQNQQRDLLIGARSIEKYQLLSAVNKNDPGMFMNCRANLYT
jgi:hypothetical protein